MASETKLPGSLTSSSSAPESAEAWVTPNNALTDNATYASITAASYDSPDISARLRADQFGFAIPGTATIDGIVVEIERRCGAGTARDFRVQLLDDAGALIGDNKASATSWPSTDTVASYGSSSDLWGASWTPTSINDTQFGMVLSVEATSANVDIFVDFFRITVHYTDGGGGGGPTYVGWDGAGVWFRATEWANRHGIPLLGDVPILGEAA